MKKRKSAKKVKSVRLKRNALVALKTEKVLAVRAIHYVIGLKAVDGYKQVANTTESHVLDSPDKKPSHIVEILMIVQN